MRARWPLRMRVSISPRGSLKAILRSSLPARLHHARDLAGGGQLAERDARQFKLAIESTRATGHLAPVANAHLRRIARKLGELQAGGELLLGRERAVLGDRLQLGALVGELLHQLGAALVLLDSAGLSHGTCS